MVDDAIIQFKAISEARNSIVHYPSFITSDKGRVSSNIARALTKEKIREFRVSPGILGYMASDLEKIGDHAQYALSVIVTPHVPHEDLVRALPSLVASWQYKRPEDQQPSPRRRERKGRS